MENYGHLLTDEESGLEYITDFASGKRLFKYPPCRICGIARYGFSNSPTESCLAHAAPEANENEEAA